MSSPPAHDSRQIARSSREVLATHSRTFRLASLWLPAAARREVAVLYALCRLIDDTADETVDCKQAKRSLHHIRREVDGAVQPRPLVAEFTDIAARRGIDLGAVRELIDGVTGDLATVRMESDADLLRYCYRVAGTVGLMMCPLLGVEDRRAIPHAIDLGIAMQLTNICRDVREDAMRNRVYLPESRLNEVGISASHIVDRRVAEKSLARVVEGVLDLADRYYQSADQGMHYIPRRSRLAILVASRTYRAIGVRLRRRRCRVMAGRAVVPAWEKARWTASAILHWLRPSSAENSHRSVLHHAIEGLPGVEAGGGRR